MVNRSGIEDSSRLEVTVNGEAAGKEVSCFW
jgi:hypothetical protein